MIRISNATARAALEAWQMVEDNYEDIQYRAEEHQEYERSDMRRLEARVKRIRKAMEEIQKALPN